MKRSCFQFLGMFLQRNETNFSDKDLIFHSFLFQIFPHPSPISDLQNIERKQITLLEEFLGTTDEMYFSKCLKVNPNKGEYLVNLKFSPLKCRGSLWGLKWDNRCKNDLWTVQHYTELTLSVTIFLKSWHLWAFLYSFEGPGFLIFNFNTWKYFLSVK